MFWILIKKSSETKWWEVLKILVASLVLLNYLSLKINHDFDDSIPVEHGVIVFDKEIRESKSTKSYSKYYSLKVTPWGSFKKMNWIDVDESVFDRLESMDSLYIKEKEGALGSAWIYVE